MSRAKAPAGSMAIAFKVELYNLFVGDARNPSNGWLVARYVDGCRANTIKDFECDEHAARNFCAYLNEGFSVRHV